jgi:nonribosomal peptide synthetase protein VioF
VKVTDFRTWRLAAEATIDLPAVPTEVPPRYTLARVEEVAAAFGDTAAVQTTAGSLRYADLLRQAKAITGWLRSRGIGPEDRVVLLADKALSVYPALLGVLGARAAFVPLDPEAPPERSRALMRRVTASALVTTAELATQVEDLVDHLLLVDEPLAFQRARVAVVETLPAADPSWDGDPANLAYVIFTSGSSGTPKGVEVERRSLDTFAEAISALAGCGPGSRVTQSARLCFDASLQQILAALVTGATLVPVPDEVRVDGPAMAAWLRDEAITHWDSVPSLWAPVVSSVAAEPDRPGLPHLHTVILAGEAPRAADINRWLDAVPQARLFNAYGPTEATVDATAFEITGPVNTGPVSIGSPLPGVGAHIIDAGGQVCEFYIEGEIHLEGMCLARGYLDDPDATAAAFPTIDLGKGRPRRMYRTGDLCYRLPDGNLVCTGRRDNQVKVNGVRIEPAEIEAALIDAPGVREAAVTAYTPHNKIQVRLAAAIAGVDDIDVVSIRAHIARILPAAMLPTLLLPVSALPRTPSGKVDLRKVRQLAEQVRQAAGSAVVDDCVFGEVRSACQKVLGVDVGAEDDLLALGLDSISGIRLRAELATRGLTVQVRHIFTHSTVGALSTVVTRALAPATAGASRLPADGVDVPLLPAQRSLLAAVLTDPTQRSTGLVQEVHVFGTVLDSTVTARAFEELVHRYDAFRTSILLDLGSQPRQRIADAGDVRLAPRLVKVPGTALARVTEEIADEELAGGFDIGVAPLLKLAVVTSERDSSLVWTMHHLVTDGWSWELVCRDFTAIYTSLLDGRPPGPPPPGPSLAALATAAAGVPPEKEMRHLLDDLSGTIGAQLTAAVTESHGRAVRKETISLELSVEETTSVYQEAKRAAVTASAVFLHAVGAALARMTGEADISLGLVSAGRHLSVPAVDRVVAPLARITPASWRAGSSTVSTAHEQLQRAVAIEAWDVDAALAQAGVPIGVRAPRVTFLFQNYTSGLAADAQAARLGLDHQRSYSRETAHSDLAAVVHTAHPDDRSALAIRLEYWPTRVDGGVARRLLREIHRELRRVVTVSG